MTCLLQARGLALVLPTGRRLLQPCDITLDGACTALVGANGVGKTRLCRVLLGLDEPDGGRVLRSGSVGWFNAGMLPDAGPVSPWLKSGVAGDDLHADFGIDGIAADARLEHLSGGERQRLGLAHALAARPDLLILDEPGTHLDRTGRQALIRRIRTWPGGVLLVSHDRELLALAERVLELSAGRLHSYAMDFDRYLHARRREQDAAARDVDAAKRDLKRLHMRAQLSAERAQSRAAQGIRARRRGSQGPMYFDYVAGRAESGSGRRQRQAQARIETAQSNAAAARERLRLETAFDLRLPAAPIASGKSVIDAQGLRIEAGRRVLLDGFDFTLRGPERVAISGRNGSGKSLLLRTFAGLREADGGRLRRTDLPTAWIDQHARPALPRQNLLDNLLEIQPELSRGESMQRLAWFGFVDEQLRQPASSLSAGERVRFALACQLAGKRAPALLMLDEPDNHLDLPALAIVQCALLQFRGALIVVSHSEAFLQSVAIERRIHLDADPR